MNIWKRSTALLLTAAVAITLYTPYTAMGAEEEPEEPVVIAEGDDELPCGLSGMPDGFMLSDEDIQDKQEAAEAGMLESLSDMTPGTDYVDGEIIFTAYDREYAKQVAKAYNAKLISCAYGVAQARITDKNISVVDAVAAGLDPRFSLPAVSPNTITRLEEPIVSDNASADGPEALEDSYMSVGWKDATVSFDDPALRPGYKFYEKDAFNPDAAGTKTAGYQWMHDMVGSYEAWWSTTGKDITVAVIDTGVDAGHEDLQSQEGGRYVRVVTDVYTDPDQEKNGPSYMCDDSGHGTHVAGIIGATGGNGIGGAGIAPDVNILGLPVFSYFEKYNNTACIHLNTARAINYVAGVGEYGIKGERRADIINLSLGSSNYNPVMNDAIRNAYEQDVTVVAAMGNDDTNSVHYPAAYDHVIAVSAVDREKTRTYFSCYGDWADIAAPGIDIYSTWNGHGIDYNNKDFRLDDHNDWYCLMNGTSMASPVVAGVCALYMSAVGHVSPDEMERVLKLASTKVSDKSIGAGIVNVAEMIPDTAKNGDLSIPVIETSDTETGEFRQLKDGDILYNDALIRFNAKDGKPFVFAYSVNGKNPTFKDDTAGPGSFIARYGSAIPVEELLQNGAPVDKPFTLKVVYMSPQGTVGKVASVNISIKLKDPVGWINIDGPVYVARGRSVSYTYEMTPPGVSDLKTTWSLSEGTPAGVSINSKTGKLSVNKNVPVDTKFRIILNTNKKVETPISIEVTVKDPCPNLFIDRDKTTPDSYSPKRDKNGSLTSVTLFTVNVPTSEDAAGSERDESRLYFMLDSDLPPCYKESEAPWPNVTSSRPGVAYAGFDKEKGSWYIQSARTAGTSKITWTMSDGSGAKATLTVKNMIPVSSVHVSTKNTQEIVCPGKSVQFLATAENTYGKPSNPKLKWDYIVLEKNRNTGVIRDLTKQWKALNLARITQSGKLTVDKKAAGYIDKAYQINVSAIANATDGSGQKGSRTVLLSNPTSKMMWRVITRPNDSEGVEKIDSGWCDKPGAFGTEAYLSPKEKKVYSYDTFIYIDTYGTDYKGEQLILASSGKPRVASISNTRVVYLDDEGNEVASGGKRCVRYSVVYDTYSNFKPGRTEKVKMDFSAIDGSGKKTSVTLNIHANSMTE